MLKSFEEIDIYHLRLGPKRRLRVLVLSSLIFKKLAGNHSLIAPGLPQTLALRSIVITTTNTCSSRLTSAFLRAILLLKTSTPFYSDKLVILTRKLIVLKCFLIQKWTHALLKSSSKLVQCAGFSWSVTENIQQKTQRLLAGSCLL